MAKKVFQLDISDPRIQEKMNELHGQLIAHSPKHVQRLGKILRSRSEMRMRLFLRRHGHAGKIPKEDIPQFMDYLITKRLDLKDMAHDARQRLRQHWLDKATDEEKLDRTEDYMNIIEKQDKPLLACRDCKWFGSAPADDEEPCMKLGTMGADIPCYGFTLKKLV